MRGVWNAVALVVLVAILGTVGWYYGVKDPIKNHMKLGLDLRGGVHMVLQAVDDPTIGMVTDESLEAALEVVDKRVNSLGVSEPVIQLDKANKRIIIQIAGETDTERARALIGKTAVLTFVDPEEKIVLDGRDIERAGVQPDQAGGYQVTLALKGEGPQKFAEATKKWIGSPIAIKLDEEIISAPTVQSEISNGNAVITGNFTVDDAKDLAQLINGGALPVKLVLSENRVVSATLGADSLNKSALAGMIGMGFVILFMWALYKLPGLMATIALTIYAFLTMGFLLSINAVFTLPGIAGLLLSIGMAVDANVIIFERIKEELRSGKGLRSGIDAGFHRAFSAVIDSNVTTLIAGIILYSLGTTAVKGFALTLTVGVFLSLFTSITVTRWLIKAMVGIRPWTKRLFGVKEVG